MYVSPTTRGQDGHLVFPISLKNKNLVEDVEILLPVKFHEIPFSRFRAEVKNVLANQRPRRPSCFLDRPEKHKLGRGPWDLPSWQVSSNSSQRIRGQGGHLIYPIGPKNTNLVEDIEIFFPVKFCWIPFSGFKEEVKNVSANQRRGGHLGFPIGPKNTNFK